MFASDSRFGPHARASLRLGAARLRPSVSPSLGSSPSRLQSQPRLQPQPAVLVARKARTLADPQIHEAAVDDNHMRCKAVLIAGSATAGYNYDGVSARPQSINTAGRVPGRLTGPIFDVINMERALQSQEVEIVEAFKKPGHELRRSVVLQTLQQLFLDCMRTNALAVVHYSGHGRGGSGDWVFDNEAGDGMETISIEDLQHEYRAAYAIRQREIGQVNLEVSCGVLVIADCCHSGAWCDRLIQPMRRHCSTQVAAHLILNGRNAKHAGHIELALETQRKAQLRPEMVGYADGIFEAAWLVLASCRADELASDSGRYGGHFTSELCRNLKFAHYPGQLDNLPHTKQVIFCRVHSEWFDKQHPLLAPDQGPALGWKLLEVAVPTVADGFVGPATARGKHLSTGGTVLWLPHCNVKRPREGGGCGAGAGSAASLTAEQQQRQREDEDGEVVAEKAQMMLDLEQRSAQIQPEVEALLAAASIDVIEQLRYRPRHELLDLSARSPRNPKQHEKDTTLGLLRITVELQSGAELPRTAYQFPGRKLLVDSEAPLKLKITNVGVLGVFGAESIKLVHGVYVFCLAKNDSVTYLGLHKPGSQLVASPGEDDIFLAMGCTHPFKTLVATANQRAPLLPSTLPFSSSLISLLLQSLPPDESGVQPPIQATGGRVVATRLNAQAKSGRVVAFRVCAVSVVAFGLAIINTTAIGTSSSTAQPKKRQRIGPQ